jgi:hypothetical protein
MLIILYFLEKKRLFLYINSVEKGVDIQSNIVFEFEYLVC